MLIEVKTDAHIPGSEQFSDEVKAVVHTALDRYGDHIRRVDVHLSDVIGNKAGHDDKRCMMEAHRDGRPPIVVTQQESTIDQAIQGAVHNLKKSVDGALGEEGTLDQLRDHH
jgi:hypothetical protein